VSAELKMSYFLCFGAYIFGVFSCMNMIAYDE